MLANTATPAKAKLGLQGYNHALWLSQLAQFRPVIALKKRNTAARHVNPAAITAGPV